MGVSIYWVKTSTVHRVHLKPDTGQKGVQDGYRVLTFTIFYNPL